MIVRPLVKDGGMTREAMPGDVIGGGENILAGAIATAGAGTWTGAAIATGIIRRTGPVGAYTDTTDTAQNIITALAGNQGSPDVVPGSSMRLIFINTVAQAHTYAGGEGVVTGTGTLDSTASLVHEYILVVLNATPRVSLQATNLTASKVITFSTPQAVGTVTPGMWMSGTNITSGTRVVGVTLNGSGMISGVTTDTNSTGANATSVALVFSPAVRIDSLRQSAL